MEQSRLCPYIVDGLGTFHESWVRIRAELREDGYVSENILSRVQLQSCVSIMQGFL